MSSPSTAACSARAPIRILIADDHPLVRTGIRHLLETRPDLSVVAESGDGTDAIAKVEDLAPDVALVDLVMPNIDGFAVVRRIVEAKSPTRAIVLSAHEDAHCVRDAFTCGAAGFVPKSAVAVDLFCAIEAVTTGRQYVHPRFVQHLMGMHARPAGWLSDLSQREGEVLRHVARGYSNKEIAAMLGVSVKTVETYKGRAMQKLGAGSRVDIIRIAVERGWLANSTAGRTPTRRDNLIAG